MKCECGGEIGTELFALCNRCGWRQVAAIPPVRSKPLLAVYERFQHLDRVLRECETADNPIYRIAAALWVAVTDVQTANDKADGLRASSNTVRPLVGL